MGTATPAIETYTNALNHKYGLVTLTGRFGDVLMPEILVRRKKITAANVR